MWACVALWVSWRALALAARGAWAQGADGIEPLWSLPLAVAADVALVVACFAAARWFAGSASCSVRRLRWLPALLLVLSAFLRTADAVHCYVAMAHISVGFWWHVSWSAWPLLVESGAPVAVGVAAGWGWFAFRALGRHLRHPRRAPPARLAIPVACALFAISAAWVDHSQHGALLPELNTPRTLLSFMGVRPTPSVVDVDDALWRRWQAAGLVPRNTHHTDRWPLWHERAASRPALEGRQPDVVVVLLESFSASLTSPYGGDGLVRRRGFRGALTPQLSRLARRASVVDGYTTQARPTHFGLVASLCGLLPGSWPLDTRMHERPPPALSCLPELFAQSGRQTVFVQGSSLTFTGLGPMLRRQGFAEVVGRDLLSRRFPKAPRNPWGLYDREVMAFAGERITALRAGQQPYLLTLMTVDSHMPGTPRPDCVVPSEFKDDETLSAIHCADKELGTLLDLFDRLGLWQDTMLVVSADHAMPPTPALHALLGGQADPFAPLPLLIHDPAARLPKRWRVHGGQLDLARTVAGLAGVWRRQSAMQGQDLTVESGEGRMVIGLAGRRLVGLRMGLRSATLNPARLARRCARGLPALAAGDLDACDVTRYLHWLDRLWFDGRIRPQPRAED